MGTSPPTCPEIIVLTSDANGGFGGLAPQGRYRIAAVKPGYELLLSEIGVFAGGFLELRLRPSGPASRGRDPRKGDDPNLDWILRNRSPDPLRDLRPVVALQDEDRASRSDGTFANLLRSLDGEMAWSMSGLDPFGESPAAGETAGQAASLAVGGEIGGGGRWSVAGGVDRSATGLSGGEPSHRELRTESVAMSMDYRLGEADRIRGEIRYGQAVAESLSDAGGTVYAGQVRRASSIRSRWDRRLDDLGALYLDGSYVGTGIAWHTSAVPGGATDPTVAALPNLDTWRARAGYARDLGSHTIDLGVRASLRQGGPGAGDVTFLPADAGSPAGSRVERSEIGVFGGDDWRLADRYVLNYGMGYWSDLDTGAGWLVPSVGFVREPDVAGGLRLRSLLIVRLDDPLTDRSVASAASGEPGREGGTRIGGLVGLDQHPASGTGFAVTMAVVPFHEDLFAGAGGFDPLTASKPVVVLSDSGAERMEVGVELDRVFGALHGSVSGSIGRVEGRVSPIVDEIPLQTLGEGDARYWLTRVRGVYAPTETTVVVDFQRIVGSSAGEPGVGPEAHEYRRVELVVQQDLPWMNRGARWRLLMAYRGLLYGTPDAVPGGLTAGTVSRLSGGVSVVF